MTAAHVLMKLFFLEQNLESNFINDGFGGHFSFGKFRDIVFSLGSVVIVGQGNFLRQMPLLKRMKK